MDISIESSRKMSPGYNPSSGQWREADEGKVIPRER